MRNLWSNVVPAIAERYHGAVTRAALALILGTSCLGSSIVAHAAVVTYSSSAAFTAATGSSAQIQDYSSGSAGQLISNGGSFGGQTYTFANGSGDISSGILTNQFNSFSAVSLGAKQAGGQQFFFGQDSVTISFAAPVVAFGAFFNVNRGSGSYSVTEMGNSAVSNSTVYDTPTFVFAGLTSTTPFSSVTLTSSSAANGSFNIPEIEFVSAVPEPASMAMLGVSVCIARLVRRRRH